MRQVKKFKHKDYIVDDSFARSKEYRYTVADLTELEAKDLVCDLMHCVTDMSEAGFKIKAIAQKHNFAV